MWLNFFINYSMNVARVFLCISFPPLAVIDNGCGTMLIVLLLSFFGWVPGVIAAIILSNQ